MDDPEAFRRQFPVFAQRAYLNAGTCGPVPSAAVDAAGAVASRAAVEGRAGAFFELWLDGINRQRAEYAALLSADVDDVALTTATSDGMVRVLTGLDLGPGDEILTSDEEHPGLQGPLAAVAAQRGVTLKTAPLESIADAVGSSTKLVACSDVGWVSGKRADVRGVDVPVLLDGAQGIGAVPVNPVELGATFYAAAGQKWLCGPIGTGMLWVAPEWRDRLNSRGPTYLALEDPSAGLEAVPHPTARRFDTPSLGPESTAAALAALDVFSAVGWSSVHERAASLAESLAASLAERGKTVAPRDRTTLVSWEDPDPVETRGRLAEAGIVIRDLPGTPLLRASVGAWNDESDLERLLEAV